MIKVVRLILVLMFATTAWAQTQPNDCVNALIVCGNGAFSSNASGSGNTQEVNACGGFESNTIWLLVNVVQAGTLGFEIIPDDPSITVDYDFWVFGPNPVCGALGSPIRCATTNPQEAGLTSNHTGMNGTSLATQVGPGSNGNGYVRWLNVLAGQSYYIVIDRPVGDGGFQIQWTGTATNGTGAFTAPPSANSIPDVSTCSNTPNIGIFNLDTVRPSINPDTTNNTISFHTSLEDAVDNVNPLPNIYANTSNPQTIYVRVTNNVAGCYTTTDFDLVVNQVPNATISVSSSSICNGDSVTVTFTGTPNATFDYNVGGGPTITNVLNASGLYNIVYTPTASTTFTLTGVRRLDGSGNVICYQPLNQSVTVLVSPVLTASISGTTSVCSGDTAVVTFTGTPNTTVTYTVNGGSNQTILLNGTGTASLTTPVLAATETYDLVSVSTNGTPVCSQNVSGSVAITVLPIPTVTISGTTTICSGSTTIITFSGTPNAEVIYTVDGGSNQTILLNGTGFATLTTPALVANTIYELVSVTLVGTPACNQTQSGSAVITISAPPTASISGTTTICSGNTTPITFTGTANATVTYTVNGGSNQTIVLDGLGAATLNPVLTSDTTYALVNVSLAGTPPCSQTVSGSAIVTVEPIPTVTISGATTMLCEGDSTIINFLGTPNAIVTYTINGGVNQTVSIGPAGNVGILTESLTVNTTYSLVSIVDNNGSPPACGQNISGSVLVTVNPKPVLTNLPSNVITCSGQLITMPAYTVNPSDSVLSWTNDTPSIGLAASGNGTISSFTAVNNSNTVVTATIVIRATRQGCTTTSTFTITINPLPLANPVITDYALCDYNNPGDEEEVFTLDTKTLEIANGQTGVTVTYYATQTDAQNQTNGLPNSYTNTSNPQQIWINISDNVTGCNTVSSFNLVINPLPLAVTPLPINECSTGSSITQAEFDLTVNENVITGGVP
ncbi:beta strand repeat-containing protein, partial [Flavobacterium solisilvae]|nr:hypothetical protein [Flavobacterium solisilvae]